MRGEFVRASAVWMVIISAETIHGIARTVLLAPVVGDLRARQIGDFTESVMILAISALAIRWLDAKSPKRLLLTGLFGVVLTVIFEVALGRLVLGLTWERIVSDHDLTQGGLMSFGPDLDGRIAAFGASLRDEKVFTSFGGRVTAEIFAGV
jgi:hypothetical protein